ncbi:MAG: HAD-IIIC family phosphatase [Ilumatobacteraceae bacterium]
MLPGDQDPHELRREVDAALQQSEFARAREQLERLWRHNPGPASAAFVNSRLTKIPATGNGAAATVALLRSFTVEPIVPLLRAAAGLNGLELTVHVGDFNTYAQEILDPTSALYTRWSPDIVILAVQTRDIAPELWSSFADLGEVEVEAVVERTIAEFENMVRSFRISSTAALLIHGLELPHRPALGEADRFDENGQSASIERINRRLREIAASTPGTHVLDLDALVAAAGRRHWYDADKWASMRMPIHAAFLRDIAAAWLRKIQPLTGRTVKALVVDLDNTLWGGVLGEDLVEGVVLAPEGVGSGFWHLQRAIRNLTARGILLAICSKNNETDVREMFDQHLSMVLRWEDFAAVRINWDDKPANIRSIADELNIGLDAIAFVDDSPAECELVRRELPDVVVIHLEASPEGDDNPIVDNPFFERVRLTTDDRRRAQQYAEQRQRHELEHRATSLDGYLHGLETVVSVRQVADADIARVAQLTQKTNQFNVTTKRYSEAEIAAMVEDDDHLVLLATVSDRFGDHGTVGVVIVRTSIDRWDLEAMLLSCRVIGRGVETAVIAAVSSDALNAGVSTLRGTFNPTKKNAPAAEFFEQHGFIRLAPDDAENSGSQQWSRDLATSIESPTWITTIEHLETTRD